MANISIEGINCDSPGPKGWNNLNFLSTFQYKDLPPPVGTCNETVGLTECKLDCVVRHVVKTCDCRMNYMPGIFGIYHKSIIEIGMSQLLIYIFLKVSLRYRNVIWPTKTSPITLCLSASPLPIHSIVFVSFHPSVCPMPSAQR